MNHCQVWSRVSGQPGSRHVWELWYSHHVIRNRVKSPIPRMSWWHSTRKSILWYNTDMLQLNRIATSCTSILNSSPISFIPVWPSLQWPPETQGWFRIQLLWNALYFQAFQFLWVISCPNRCEEGKCRQVKPKSDKSNFNWQLTLVRRWLQFECVM